MTTVEARSINPDVEAIRHHYEVPNELYRLILGPTMMYSGGYWEDGEDLVTVLDEAQERKLDAFTDLARAAHTDTVLDIGCGWGTMLNRLTTVHGVKKAVGVTLSRTQADFVDALNNPAIEARVESWEDHRLPEGHAPYDAAFCINALEHFVLSSLTPKERTQRYRVFFKQVHSLLKPGARFVLHTMTVENPPLRRRLLDDLKFLQREEFEGCHIPRLPELATGLDGLFEVTEIRNEPESFARACRAWLQLLATRRDEAVTMTDETTVARFERYLDIFAYTLEDHIFNNFRVTLTRRA
ncbi:class I SAM-dependent methyltransferase [Streptomyces sp. CBMA156]|uniref:class I SAM-dependent methyltransferase n=1 Tax=Streptomyces sp. CBMA156 TaxID=1930280 RepID=UPI0016618FFF|nr:class I SAM-dependent methyltransferase [Streptomyces sp. CBMA156]MBD0672756.1 cyclopropane-fatty-acyl-phospholipid synthase [Streptomyces sp. CBMA156]MBD0673736.1 cyclopropane-fatty-acyl-phospholipid synthase [Streptomyces sp. CBMA156]